MRELPLLMNGPMVRGILDGRKTAMRCLVTPQLELGPWLDWQEMPPKDGKARYRRVGPDYPDTEADDGIICPYGVGDRLLVSDAKPNPDIEWDPIPVDVVAVRVERLRDIPAEQAIAEGMVSHLREHDAVVDLRQQFADLWDGLAKPGTTWADNPWVWVVEFRRVEVARADQA